MLSLGRRIGRSRPRLNQSGQPTRPLRPEEIEVLRRTVQPSRDAPLHPARGRMAGLTVVILILGLAAMVLPLILQRLILD